MNNVTDESYLFPSNLDWENISKYGGFTLLHKGTYADTYRAQKAGKYFLLKTVNGNDDYFLRVLKREYEISIGLDHPNIASSVSFEFIKDLGPCIVMEYVDGKDLNLFLSSHPSLKAKKKILRQLLEAVRYLHGKNIVHNDLKPENIIISSREDNLKLIDFGLSDDDTHYLAKTLGCTPKFASPELISGDCGIDARSDIYSIGKLIQLIFPHKYHFIAHKCTRNDARLRFRNIDAIRASLNLIKIFQAVCIALCIILPCIYCLGPKISEIVKEVYANKEYNDAITACEACFTSECINAGVDYSDPPIVSYSSYFNISDDPKERRDSCNRILQMELKDRIVMKKADEALDSLYLLYSTKVGKEPYDIFGYMDIIDFRLSFTKEKEKYLSAIEKTINRDRFYTHCDNLNTEMESKIKKQVESLKTMDDLSYPERFFYTKLAAEGKPFRKFKRE